MLAFREAPSHGTDSKASAVFIFAAGGEATSAITQAFAARDAPFAATHVFISAASETHFHAAQASITTLARAASVVSAASAAGGRGVPNRPDKSKPFKVDP